MPSSPRLVAALAVLTAVAAPAQQRAGRARPVPGVAAPQPLPDQLPKARAIDRGAGYVLAQRGGQPVVLWCENVLREAPFARGDAPDVPQLGFGIGPPDSLQIGDFDGDGQDDVLGRFDRNVALLLPDRVPQMARRSPHLLRERADGPWFSGRAFDWFGDGRADVAFFDGTKIKVHREILGDGPTDVLLDLGETNLPLDATAAGTAGDWDLDGLPDLVLALPERGLVWCRHEGSRTVPKFREPTPLWPTAPGVVVCSLVLFPVDEDPWPDLVVSTAAPVAQERADFVRRVPRGGRSQADNELLRQAEADLADLEREAARVQAGLASERAEGPFGRLLRKQQLEATIARLRWQDVPMAVQRPYVHLRAGRQ